MARVKICGVNDRQGYEAAAEADWVAFNFFPRSPRFVTPDTAADIAQTRGPKIVALFVAPTDDEVVAVIEALNPDILQLYAEAPRVAELRARFGLPVWRAVGVTTPADLPADLEGADALLIEPRPPAGATRPGGNATALDWSILAGWNPGFDWLLAGGLTPQNVAHAIAASGATAVDVSSGVESVPGRKDPVLIQAFLAAAR